MAYLNGAAARAALAGRGVDRATRRRWLQLHRRADFAAHLFRDRDGAPWRVRPYQRASIESFAPRKVHCDGRDVGKTTEIELTACWAALCCPRREMLIATQTENHLFPLMQRIARRVRATPLLANGLAELRQSPAWQLRFSNGFVLWGRIAGPRGINFQGMHVDWQIVDEAQEMTDAAWSELFQALNGGGRRWVYGVPNGVRNRFHQMTGDPEAQQFNWPSTLNPDFSPEKDAELARLYGGPESPGYLHRVLGLHGAPENAVFSLDDYAACIQHGIDFHNLLLGANEEFAPPAACPIGAYYLGGDLGFARDPTELVVYQDLPPHLVNILRLRLNGVNYPRQQAVIAALDEAYDFRAVGLDAGNNGRAVAHALLALGGDWPRKLHAFEFGGTLQIMLPDGTPARRRVKEFMTELLQRRMAERSLMLPPLADREAEYAAHTCRINAAGRPVYSKGRDHLIDADRCALLAHYLDTREGGPPGTAGIGLLTF
jgi:hypothetical protein